MRSDVKQTKLRHSGHSQNPLSTAFPIIILRGKFIRALELVFFAGCMMFPSFLSRLVLHIHSRLLVGGHKSELVWDLYIVQQPSRFHRKKKDSKQKVNTQKQQTKQEPNQKNKHHKHNEESDRRSSSVN